jgi:D-3-phosphoglycerate dehydrogenase
VTNILVSESSGFSPAVAQRLRGLGDLKLSDLGRSELLTEIREANVLWIRLRHRIDGEVFAAAPHLRAIVSPTTGVDHIDLGAASNQAIEVLSLRGHAEQLRDVRATAEHTLGLMLALLRHVPAAAAHVGAGGWDRDLFWGHELHGKTVGIVGYGRLGRLVARCLAAFDARVLVTDRPGRAIADLEERVEPCALDELLSRSDIVTLHASLDDSTRGLLGARELAMMQSGSWLVNTARGALLDEEALLAALRDGHLGGAALDVLADEHSDGSRPLVDYARDNANLLITPHIGGATIESRAKTEGMMAARLAEFLATERVQ